MLRGGECSGELYAAEAFVILYSNIVYNNSYVMYR